MRSRLDRVTNNQIVRLVNSSTDGDTRTTSLLIDGPLPDAVAPAELVDPTARRTVLTLHRLKGHAGGVATFETYRSGDGPSVGEYVLQPWWTPEALALVEDRHRSWVRARYPGDHPSPYPDTGPDYCRLTYESLEPGVDAYTDTRGAWISVDAFKRFIDGDELHIRTASG